MTTVVHPEYDPATGTWFVAGMEPEAPSLRQLTALLGRDYRIKDFKPMGKISYDLPTRDERILDAYASGKSYRQIAIAESTSRSAVSGIVSRARIRGDQRARKRK